MFSIYRASKDTIGRLPAMSVPAVSFSILETPQRFREEILNLIETSSRRIYITALYLQDDETGREILDAIYLRASKCPSLKVYILVDFHRAQRGLIGKGRQCGNNIMYREYSQRYPSANVTFLGVPVKSKEMFGVLHLKGFVFDNTVLYSGASINNVYLNKDNKYRLDRYEKIVYEPLADCMVAFLLKYLLNAAAVQDLTRDNIPSAGEISNQIGSLKKHLKKAIYHINSEARKEGCVSMTPLCGLGNVKNRLNRTILSLMQMTKQKITICTPYFNMPANIQRVITKLLKKGIKINLVIGDKVANDFYIPEDQPFNRVGAVPYLYEGFVREFCRKNQSYIDNGQLNIMMWKDGTNTYHVKGIYVDDDYYLITGNNLNPRAWRLDFENAILIQDPEHLMKDSFSKELDFILSNTTRITHWTNLEKFEDFPERIQNYLKKIFRLKLHLFVKRII